MFRFFHNYKSDVLKYHYNFNSKNLRNLWNLREKNFNRKRNERFIFKAKRGDKSQQIIDFIRINYVE